MKFDWYAATIKASAEVVNATLKSAFPDSDIAPMSPLHGYTEGFNIVGEEGSFAKVLAGGANGYPHAWSSGQNTEKFVEAIRERFPLQHTVSRMDSAQDFDEPGAWDALAAICICLADERDLKVGHVGDFHRGLDGRTLYIGSMKSDLFVRLYEKGKQLGAPHSPNWVRMELVLRPSKTSRQAAALATPVEAWGYGRWSTEMLKRVMATDVPRVNMYETKVIDDIRALEHMTKQYGAMMRRCKTGLAQNGRTDWESFGKLLGVMISKARS